MHATRPTRQLLGARLFLGVDDDVRRVRLTPRGAHAEVLHGANVPAGGAVEEVRGEDLAPAQRALLVVVRQRGTTLLLQSARRGSGSRPSDPRSTNLPDPLRRKAHHIDDVLMV